MSHLKNLRFFKVQALDPKFVLALEPRVLKLEDSSFGIRLYIYVLKGGYKETPPKVAITVILGAKAFLPLPCIIIILERHATKVNHSLLNVH